MGFFGGEVAEAENLADLTRGEEGFELLLLELLVVGCIWNEEGIVTDLGGDVLVQFVSMGLNCNAVDVGV